VVGRGACEPASACRAAIRTHQRPEKQLRFGEMVQELQRGSMNNIPRQVEVQGVDAATQLGAAVVRRWRHGGAAAGSIYHTCLPLRAYLSVLYIAVVLYDIPVSFVPVLVPVAVYRVWCFFTVRT
jgi:hypothetical protein